MSFRNASFVSLASNLLSGHRVRLAALALAISAGALPGGRANAAALVSDLSTTPDGATNVPAGEQGGQFTLTHAATITGATASLEIINSLTLAQVSASISPDNGPQGFSGVVPLAASTSDSGTLSTTSANPISFVFSPLDLPAGTYWLVVDNASNSPGNVLEWEYDLSTPVTNTGVDGTVNNVGQTAGVDPFGRIFEVDGTVGPVPEPASLGLLGVGGLVLLRRRRTANKPA